jgi:hypothetical protein
VALRWGGGGALLLLAALELALGVGLDRRVALSFANASAAQRHQKT